jgi:hypothetical protein
LIRSRNIDLKFARNLIRPDAGRGGHTIFAGNDGQSLGAIGELPGGSGHRQGEDDGRATDRPVIIIFYSYNRIASHSLAYLTGSTFTLNHDDGDPRGRSLGGRPWKESIDRNGKTER